ncbi:MAG: hypothetical protein R2838_24720 [Caldilineaceae bacterium]
MERCIDVVRAVGGRLFVVHMTTSEGVEMIAAPGGLDILAETCTHYLVFTDDMLRRPDGIKWICSPPLRQADQDALWQGGCDGRRPGHLRRRGLFVGGDLLRAGPLRPPVPTACRASSPVSSCSYSEGVAKGRLSLPRFVEIVAGNPARASSACRAKARCCPATTPTSVLDPTVKWTMGQANSHSPNDWHAYEGRAITGKIASLQPGPVDRRRQRAWRSPQALPQARPAAMSGAPRPECSMQIQSRPVSDQSDRHGGRRTVAG